MLSVVNGQRASGVEAQAAGGFLQGVSCRSACGLPAVGAPRWWHAAYGGVARGLVVGNLEFGLREFDENTGTT